MDNGGEIMSYKVDVGMMDRRRALTGERKTYEIKQLWDRSKEILCKAAIGMKQVDIAKEMNITSATVSSTINSQLGRDYIKEIRDSREEMYKKQKERISDLADSALSFYENVFSRNGELKLKKEIAETVLLELSGHRVPTKTQSASMSIHANLAQIAEFKKRGLAQARKSGNLAENYND